MGTVAGQHPEGSRILVVDDEPRVLSLVSRALLARGYLVDAVRTAERGLELTRTGRYELVILDLLMPGMGGEAALEALAVSHPEQRVLVLSALGDTPSKVRLLEHGASDYLSKPFAIEELTARVRAQIRHTPAPEPQHELRVDGLSLNLVRRAADAGHGPVPLSEREFLLLRHLMQRAGMPCSREELLAQVWGYQFDPGTNVVDVFVQRLRRKLGKRAIGTVRNVGYVVDVA